MGDSDLSKWIPAEYPGGSADSPDSGAVPPSLAELIRAGDADALAGFRDAHAGRVSAYCAEACPQDAVQEAVEAAFAQFVGRLRTSSEPEAELEELMIRATRSAAAGRFLIVPAASSKPSPGQAVPSICPAIPELLAAHANGELSTGEEQLTSHVERCPTCAATAIRMLAAERAFVQASGWDTELEPLPAVTAPEPVDDPPPPPPPPAPIQEPPPPVQKPPPPVRVTRRRGGLVGAVKRLLGDEPRRNSSSR